VLVDEALAAGLKLEQLFVQYGTSDLSDEMLQKYSAKVHPTQLLLVSPEHLVSALDTKTPQPIAGVFELPEIHFPQQFDKLPNRHLLVLVDVQDPGNLGTLLRTAEASGAIGLVAVGSSVDMFNPKVVRSAAGAAFRLPVKVEDDIAAGLSWCKAMGWTTYAAVLPEPDQPHRFYWDIDLHNGAIVLGNEAHGLSTEVVAACDGTVVIPMAGGTESLNIAAAGAVLAFEALKQRMVGQQS
jgi:TrmH family RNA methyltransferase